MTRRHTFGHMKRNHVVALMSISKLLGAQHAVSEIETTQVPWKGAQKSRFLLKIV